LVFDSVSRTFYPMGGLGGSVEVQIKRSDYDKAVSILESSKFDKTDDE